MSVWTRPEDDYLPLVSPEWRNATRRWFADLMLSLRLPLALTGGLFAALGVMLLLTPEPPPPSVGGDIGASAWTRQIDMPPRIALRTAGMADAVTWSRETNEGRETEDRLVAGNLDGGPFMLVVAARRPAAAPASGFYVASVRSAANAGLSVGRFGRVGDFSGPFGATETALVTLTDPAQNTVRTDCIAWRSGEQEIVLSGFLCSGGASAIENTTLECAMRDLTTTTSSDALLRRVLTISPTSAACKATVADALPRRSGAAKSVATARR